MEVNDLFNNNNNNNNNCHLCSAVIFRVTIFQIRDNECRIAFSNRVRELLGFMGDTSVKIVQRKSAERLQYTAADLSQSRTAIADGAGAC